MYEFQAKFPNCPTGMSVSAYQHWMNMGQCSRLLRGECQTPCETIDEKGFYSVDFDHILPTSKDGADTDFNLEPKCSNWNRWGKSGNYDPDYLGRYFFDQDVEVENLRVNQNQYGYSLVTGAYRDLFSSPSNKLLQTFCLLAWCVGSGKTVGMLAILMAINKVINDRGVGRKRIKTALWMVHQQDLVVSIAEECKTDPIKYGVIVDAPRVAIVQEYADWATIKNADIVFACPQSLWDSKGRKLTDQERTIALSKFDAIIIDECQFAVERYVEIFCNAPSAIKFVMSATPMDGTTGQFLSQVKNGKYAPFFRLFSVFGYRSARQMKMLKDLPSWEEGMQNYLPISGTNEVVVKNGSLSSAVEADSTRLNNCRDNAVVQRAIQVAHGIREYPAHVMVRTETIKQCKFLIKSIKEDSGRYFPPHSEGWGVNAIYTGAKPKISAPNHPWMLVKKGGKLQAGSQRLLLAVDMGQFGLNNPYCSVVAWTAPNKSLVELVQRIGRAIRIIPGVDYDKQSVYLIWPDGEDTSNAIKKAIEYLLNMDGLISDAFPGLLDTDEEVLSQSRLMADVSLTPSQRFTIQEEHGLALPDGLSPSKAAEMAEEFAKDPKEVEQVQEAIQGYLEKLNDEGFKDALFSLPNSAKFNALTFVYSESSKDTYTTDEIVDFIATHPYYSVVAKPLVSLIHKGDSLTISEMQRQLKVERDRHHKCSGKFIPVISLLGINPKHRIADIPFTETYWGRLVKWFEAPIRMMKKQDEDAFKGRLAGDLYAACSSCFGLKHFQKKPKDGVPGYAEFEPQLASAMCSLRASRLILGNAKLRGVISLGFQFPGHYRLFSEQIDQIKEAGEDE